MTLEQRIDRLERSCRRWRAACIAAAILALVACAAENKSPAQSSANTPANANLNSASPTFAGLTIRNPAGGPALNISADGVQTALQISNPSTGTSATMVVGKDGANLFLVRSASPVASSAALGVDDVSGTVDLRNAAGKTKDLEP